MEPLTALAAAEAKRRAVRATRRRLVPLLAVLAALAVGVGAALLPTAVTAPPVSVLTGGGRTDAAAPCSAPAAPPARGTPVGIGAVDPVTVARAAYAAGWRGEELVTAVAVAAAESSLRADAYNPAAGGNRGLWQINSVHQALLARGDWRDPSANAVMGFAVWTEAGGSWRPWEAYTTGRHVRYLPQARTAVVGLAAEAPVVLAPAGCVATGAPGSVVDAGDGPQGPDGLRPRAAAARATALQLWGCQVRADPCVRTVGGYAKRTIAGTSTLSDHATGRAADVMIPDHRSPAGRALGQEVADHFAANGERLGVRYVIFDRRITSLDRRGWRPYSHPGGSNPTLNHEDHVHVSFN